MKGNSSIISGGVHEHVTVSAADYYIDNNGGGVVHK